MSVSLVVNGTSYTFPNTGDESWGDNVTNWATAVSSHMLQKTGGTFTLSAEVDFGASYGLKTSYYKSRASNVSSTGAVRLANAETGISWRNAANGADLPLTVSASDRLTFNAVNVPTISSTDTLTNKTLSGASNTVTGNWNFGANAVTISGCIIGQHANSIEVCSYLESQTSGFATAGFIRLAVGDLIDWRNAANGGNNALGTSSDRLQWNAVNIPTISSTDTLSNKTIAAPTFTGVSVIAAGSAGAPSLGFTGATTTGLFLVDVAGRMGFASAGAEIGRNFESGAWQFGKAGSTSGISTLGATMQINGNATSATDSAYYSGATDGSVAFAAGTGGTSGANVVVYGSTHGSKPSAVEIRNSSTIMAALNNAGAWILGASGGTQAHAINGSLSITGAVTGTQIATPSSPSAGFNKLYFKNDNFLYTLTSAGTEAKISPAAFDSSVLCDSANGHGGTNTKIRRFTNSTTTGSDITYADSAGDGASFTINTAGLYAISYTDSYTGATSGIGISINSAQLTTNIQSITTANRVMMSITSGSSYGNVSAVVKCAATDVIRAHTNGAPDGTDAGTQFRIIRIA